MIVIGETMIHKEEFLKLEEKEKLEYLITEMWEWIGRAMWDGSCRQSEYDEIEDCLEELGFI